MGRAADNQGMLGALRNATSVVPGLFALPEFALAALYLLTWFQPTLLHPHMVAALVLLILMEFVVLHSSMILGALLAAAKDPLVRRVGVIAAIVYAAFAVMIAVTTQQFWIIPAFAVLMMNRLGPLLTEEEANGEPLARIVVPWLCCTLLYMALNVIVNAVPVPVFGVTELVAWRQPLDGTGTWFEQPHTAIAMGFAYYLISGFLDFGLARRYTNRSRAARASVDARAVEAEAAPPDQEERIA